MAEEDYQRLNSNDEVLTALNYAGFTGALISPLTKFKAVNDILLNEVYWKRKREIDEIAKGLNFFGLVDFLQSVHDVNNNVADLEIVFPSKKGLDIPSDTFKSSFNVVIPEGGQSCHLMAKEFFIQLLDDCCKGRKFL